MHLWLWIALGTLAVLVIVEELRLYKAHREFRKKDEIFQAVTENAADMRARHIPANQASQLRLLKAISAPEVDMAAVEELIKHDASLCYRLLRYLNSPMLGMSNTVRSVRHGITLLGERELIRWIRMATTLIMPGEML